MIIPDGIEFIINTNGSDEFRIKEGMTLIGQCKDCKYRDFPDWAWGDCTHPLNRDVFNVDPDEGHGNINKHFGCIRWEQKEGNA